MSIGEKTRDINFSKQTEKVLPSRFHRMGLKYFNGL
uniref:Uncharacterized protein n=1 Tax=Tetranychus urticae TaxID=32264 RepID=T1K949_TETUR